MKALRTYIELVVAGSLLFVVTLFAVSGMIILVQADDEGGSTKQLCDDLFLIENCDGGTTRPIQPPPSPTPTPTPIPPPNPTPTPIPSGCYHDPVADILVCPTPTPEPTAAPPQTPTPTEELTHCEIYPSDPMCATSTTPPSRVTPPASITAQTGLCDADDCSALVNWQDSRNGIDRYKVYKRTATGNWEEVTEVDVSYGQTRWAVTDRIPCDRTYTYGVKAERWCTLHHCLEHQL